MEWVLFVTFNFKAIELMQYKHERDCNMAATAVRLALKAKDSGSKANVICEWRPIKN